METLTPFSNRVAVLAFRREASRVVMCSGSAVPRRPRARESGKSFIGIVYASSLTLIILVAICAQAIGQTRATEPKDTWLKSIVQHIARYKRHPDRGSCPARTGHTQVHFAVDRKGRVLEAHVTKTSGIKDLDRASLDMVTRASPLPEPPDQVGGERIEFELPVRYRSCRERASPSMFKWWW